MGNERATGCNSRAGEARSAGSESPTVLPENEDGLSRGALRMRPTDRRFRSLQTLLLLFVGLLACEG